MCNFMAWCRHSYNTTPYLIPYHTTTYHISYHLGSIRPVYGFMHIYTNTTYNTIPCILYDTIPYHTYYTMPCHTILCHTIIYHTRWDPCALFIHISPHQTIPYHACWFFLTFGMLYNSRCGHFSTWVFSIYSSQRTLSPKPLRSLSSEPLCCGVVVKAHLLSTISTDSVSMEGCTSLQKVHARALARRQTRAATTAWSAAEAATCSLPLKSYRSWRSV